MKPEAKTTWGCGHFSKRGCKGAILIPEFRLTVMKDKVGYENSATACIRQKYEMMVCFSKCVHDEPALTLFSSPLVPHFPRHRGICIMFLWK